MVFDSIFFFIFLVLIGLGLNTDFSGKSGHFFWGTALGLATPLIAYYSYQYYFWPYDSSTRILWLCLASVTLACFFLLAYTQKQVNWMEACRAFLGCYLLDLCLTTPKVIIFLVGLFLMSVVFEAKGAALFFLSALGLYFFKEYPALIEDINVFQFVFKNDFFFKLFFYLLFTGFFFSRKFFYLEIEESPWKSLGYIFQRFCLTGVLFRAQFFFSPDMFNSFLFYYVFFLILPLYQTSFRHFHFEEWVLYWSLWLGLELRATENILTYHSFWEGSAFFLLCIQLSWVFSVHFFQKSQALKEYMRLFFLSFTPFSAGFFLLIYQIYILIEAGFLLPPLCLLIFLLFSFFRWRNRVMTAYQLFSKSH